MSIAFEKFQVSWLVLLGSTKVYDYQRKIGCTSATRSRETGDAGCGSHLLAFQEGGSWFEAACGTWPSPSNANKALEASHNAAEAQGLESQEQEVVAMEPRYLCYLAG